MRINRTLGLALTAAVLAVAMTGCSNSASSTASSAASSEAASSVAASSEAAESEAAAASVVSTEDIDVNGTTYSADCYGEFTLSNGDTMKLWKVKDAYADLSALPMKGMAEEFPIEAEAEQIRAFATDFVVLGIGGSALGVKDYQFAILVFAVTLAVSGVGLLIYRAVCRRHERKQQEHE